MKKDVIATTDSGYQHIILDSKWDRIMGVIREKDGRKKKKKVTTTFLAHVYRSNFYYYIVTEYKQFHLLRQDDVLTLLMGEDVELTPFGRKTLLSIPLGDIF